MGGTVMKTIEERAKKYAPDPFDPDYILPAREEYIVNIQRRAYISGATEQKVIDDERIKKLYEAIEKSKWFADSYKGKSLGEFIEVES